MTPGTAIAHYKITAKLGEGGMGAVYRATDTKLNRDVAIKVLPDSFASDPDRMARFTREAQVLASLNHPNIAAIYGVEERAIVMELVEGKTLAGPYPWTRRSTTRARSPWPWRWRTTMTEADRYPKPRCELRGHNGSDTPDGQRIVTD